MGYYYGMGFVGDGDDIDGVGVSVIVGLKRARIWSNKIYNQNEFSAKHF